MSAHIQRGRMKVLASAVIAAGAISATAHASPLVIVQLLGKDLTQGQTAFSSTVALPNVGDSIAYQLNVYLAPVGTTNSNGGSISTIVPFADGVNSLKLNYPLD